jgi:hypothetical protein
MADCIRRRVFLFDLDRKGVHGMTGAPRAYIKATPGFHKGYPDELGDHTWEATCPFCEKVCRVYAAHGGWWCDHWRALTDNNTTMMFERDPDRITADHDRALRRIRDTIRKAGKVGDMK